MYILTHIFSGRELERKLKGTWMESHSAQEDCSASAASSSNSGPMALEPVIAVRKSFAAGSLLCSPNGSHRREICENEEAAAAGMGTGWLRFVDEVANGGLEWKDVEERFDRIAKIRPGPSPVVSSAYFGYCIGMQKTPEFATELLGGLRGRRDQSAEITKPELHKHWHGITNPCFNSRVQIFFDLCDKNMDGRITLTEIKQAILLSTSSNKLFMTRNEAEEYASLVMEELDTKSRGYIEVSQLKTLLRPSLSSKAHFITDPKSSRVDHDNEPLQEPNSRAEILFRTYWRRGWMIIVWLIVCFALFAWKFTQYKHRKAFEVMGYCLCTAKGAAETLKLNMALILLPVCRKTVTWLRKHHPISSIIPFNDNLNFHKLIAGGIVIGVILHGGTHLACDFPRISGCDSTIFRQTIAARFGYNQPSYMEILGTTEVGTGIAMVILMTVAFSLATRWPRRRSPTLPRSIRRFTGFNTFWYSHHLLILVYALLIIHSIFLFLTNESAEKTTWMYIAIPVVLYFGERTVRAIRSELRDVKILKATIFPGKVVSLKLSKPGGFKYGSGMYIHIQCPQISPLEWHPFSLTSGPREDHLLVHIRALGDWSYKIYSLLQEANVSAGALDYPRIYIDGPYGAASQDYLKYDIIVLIGLGIGLTPFVSILKDIFNNLQTHRDHNCREYGATRCPSKTYLYWVTREQCSFEWFRDVMEEVPKAHQNQDAIEMHSFLTSVYQDGDARSALLRSIQVLYHAKNGIDIISQTREFSTVAHWCWQENWRSCAPISPPKTEPDLYFIRRAIKQLLLFFYFILFFFFFWGDDFWFLVRIPQLEKRHYSSTRLPILV